MKKAGLLLLLALSGGHNSVAAEAGTPFKTTFTVNSDSALRAQLPHAILQRGYIIAGTNPNTPPTTFYLEDNRTLAGREIDLMSAIGQRLGVAIQWHDTGGFDNIIPGLKSGRYDVALSNIRRDEKTLGTS